jgi:hypothetical protein
MARSGQLVRSPGQAAPARDNGRVTDVDLDTRLGDPTLDGGHERLTHIVKGKGRLTEAMVTGQPVTALCGKVWVPGRDPNRYPLCETCREIFTRETGRDPGGVS